MKRLEQTLKTYDTKIAKLKQQLYEETQKRTEVLQQQEEREKLAQEKMISLTEHMKKQSQEVFSLKQKLHVSLSQII